MTAFVKLFYQEDCMKCPPAKDVCNKLIEKKVPIHIKLFDIGTIDGMTEAAFHEVISTPTTVIVDDDENELDSWRGEASSLEDLEEKVVNILSLK